MITGKSMTKFIFSKLGVKPIPFAAVSFVQYKLNLTGQKRCDGYSMKAAGDGQIVMARMPCLNCDPCALTGNKRKRRKGMYLGVCLVLLAYY